MSFRAQSTSGEGVFFPACARTCSRSARVGGAPRSNAAQKRHMGANGSEGLAGASTAERLENIGLRSRIQKQRQAAIMRWRLQRARRVEASRLQAEGHQSGEPFAPAGDADEDMVDVAMLMTSQRRYYRTGASGLTASGFGATKAHVVPARPSGLRRHACCFTWCFLAFACTCAY